MGFVWMIIMKACAGCITWTAVLILLLSMFGISKFMYDKGIDNENVTNAAIDAGAIKTTEVGTNWTLYIGYVLWAVSIILTFAIVCNYNKIRIAIKIMQTAADFVTEVCMVTLVPPVISVLMFIWVFVWLYVASYVYSTGEFKANIGGSFYGSNDGSWNENPQLRYNWWMWVFTFLWINAFLGALNQLVIASAACIWYFSPRDPKNENDKLVEGAVRKSVTRALFYHLGTLALGSFLLAFV